MLDRNQIKQKSGIEFCMTKSNRKCEINDCDDMQNRKVGIKGSVS